MINGELGIFLLVLAGMAFLHVMAASFIILLVNYLKITYEPIVLNMQNMFAVWALLLIFKLI